LSLAECANLMGVKTVRYLPNRICGTLVVVALVIGGMVFPALGEKPETAKGGTAEGTAKAPTGMLYCVEFRGPCGPPVMPSFLAEKVHVAFLKEGMEMSVTGEPPLVSRGDLKYSAVATQGETDLRTGRIFAEVGPGSELTFKNKEGKSVVLQVDVSEVCWDLDRAAAVAKAEEAKADRLFLGRFQMEDLTSDVNVNEELGKQKSVRVSLDLVGISLVNGQEIGAFSEERRQMDVSREGAIGKAAKYLAEKAAVQFRDVGKKGSVGK